MNEEEVEGLIYFADEIIDSINASMSAVATKAYMQATMAAVKNNAQTIKSILEKK